MMRVKRYLMRYPRESRTMVVGPNCAGIISAGRAMLGIMPGNIYVRGNVGVVSRSGTLGYEAAAQMKALGIGVTTSVGIGGDPINGSSFLDHLALFEKDPDTQAVIMIGYWWAGLLTTEVWRYAAMFLVPATLGLLVGMALFARVDQRRFRQIVFALLFVSGLVLLVRG